MKIGSTGLKMSDGTLKNFASAQKRNSFERVAQAVKHGWKPEKKKNPNPYQEAANRTAAKANMAS